MSSRWVPLQAAVTALFTCCCFFLVVWAPMHVRPEKPRAASVLRGVRMNYFGPQPVKQQLTVWSSDFHIGPIADLKDLFTNTDDSVQVHVIDKSLSAHCHMTDSCAHDLRVLTPENGLTLGSCPNELKRAFFQAYQHDFEMHNVDAFLCNHAASMCEVFMAFNKPMIVLASTRYELGRHEKDRWQEWNQNLQLIAKRPGSIVLANNNYDAEYVKFFTSIPDVPVLPSYCGYVNAVYHPNRREILVGPARGVDDWLLEELQTAAAQHGKFSFASIRSLYDTYEYEDLAAHPAMVILPYQVSFMSLFEAYRMAIPLFVPSAELLAYWHVTWGVLSERTWAAVQGSRRGSSVLKKHPLSASKMRHDPNDELSYDAVLEWIQLADFYQWPHITTFTSFTDLMRKLETTDLLDVSRKMQSHNRHLLERLKKQWMDVFTHVSETQHRALPMAPTSYDAIIKHLYGVEQNACFGQTAV